MISSVVEVAGLGGNIEVLKQSFDSKVMKHNNNVPAQGLILWRAYFDEYNARVRKNFELGGMSQLYEIDLSEPVIKEMEAFRTSIIPQIVAENELQAREFTYYMMQSLHTLPRTQELLENTFY